MDLESRLREALQRCLGTGQEMPGDDEDLMIPLYDGPIDEDDFTDALEKVARDCGINLAAWDVPGPPMTSPSVIARLRTLAPFWPRAAAALDSIEDRREIVTINALAASARVGHWQSAGQSFVRYPLWTSREARHRRAVAILAPLVLFGFFAALDYWNCGGTVVACRSSFAEALVFPAVFVAVLSVVAVAAIVAVGVCDVLRISRTCN